MKYAAVNQMHSIQKSLDISNNLVKKILKELISRMKETDFNNDKLGSGNRLVQVDETMLNYKCKSHRGRSPNNKTDSLSIVEIDQGITRCFATVIPNKKAETLIPIIVNNVCSGARIYTDEHKSYESLKKNGL